MNEESKTIPVEALAALGGGRIAYVKPLTSEEAPRLFPSAPRLAPGLKLWALVAADGSPILLTDSREAAEANAFQNDLVTVGLH